MLFRSHLSMTLPSFPCSHIPYHACYLGLDADHELFKLFSSLSPAEDDWSLHEYHLLAGGSEEQINKVTISTQLAQAEKPKEIPVPNKAAFITPFGLYKPTVMFFGFCNAPLSFQAFMNHIFTDMILEKWLKIYMDDLGIHMKDDLELHHQQTC